MKIREEPKQKEDFPIVVAGVRAFVVTPAGFYLIVH